MHIVTECDEPYGRASWQVTFSLNVSPVLLSVLDQIAKEVEDRGLIEPPA